MTGGCYVCSSCSTGYEISGGSCQAKACPTGTSTYPSCSAGMKAQSTGSYSGSSPCKECVACSAGESCGCPSGKIADGNGGCKSADPCADVSCSGGQVCSNGACGCPSSKPYWSDGYCRACTSDSHCGSSQQCDTVTYTCVSVTCPNTTCYSIQNHSCVEKSGCCTSDSQCASNEACVNNTCEEQCGCESYEYCKGGKCYLQAGKCYTGEDCKSDSDGCVSHSCVPLCSSTTCSGEAPVCRAYSHKFIGCECTSSSCASGYRCVTHVPLNKCEKNSCTSNSDCASYEKCSGGECVNGCSGVTCSGTTPHGVASGHGCICECTSNSCGAGYTCRTQVPANECVKESCFSDNDCASYEKCSGGKCVNGCSGVTCSGTTPHGVATGHGCICECTSNSCSAGYTCKTKWPANECVAGGTVDTTESCKTDDDCSAEKTCVNGYCVFKD